jgi:hypothetical protein
MCRLLDHAASRGEVVPAEVAVAEAVKGGVFVPFTPRAEMECATFAPLPTTLDAGLLPAQFLQDVAQARSEVRVLSPEVDAGFAREVVSQVVAARTGASPGLVVRLYCSQAALRGVDLPAGPVRWSVEAPSKWGALRSELVLDGRLAYSGVPSLLAGKCGRVVVRRLLRG